MTVPSPWGAIRIPSTSDTPNVPFDMSNLATDVAAAITAGDQLDEAAYAAVQRVGTAEYPAGSMQDLGVQVSLPTAAEGIYLVGWALTLTVSGGPAQASGNLRIMVNGSNITGDVKHDLTDVAQLTAGSAVYNHTADGGALTAVTWFQAGSGSVRVYEDSMVWLARIGRAA